MVSDVILAEVEFPPISHLLVWPEFLFDGTPFAVNKIVLIMLGSVLITTIFMVLGGKGELVPRGTQNIAEATVGFIRNQTILPTIGPDGLKFTGLFFGFFTFIFLCNLGEVIPFIQMPATARMAIPVVLTLLVYVLFIFYGFKSQGLGYLKSTLFPPGVPAPIYILVTPIEFLSVFLVRPFSLAVRLFANMLAGHILLVTLIVLTVALWVPSWQAIFVPFPFIMLTLMTGFELMVAFLQAYIFTILAGVYIGGSIHPEH